MDDHAHAEAAVEEKPYVAPGEGEYYYLATFAGVPIVTRSTDDPEPLEGGEFARVEVRAALAEPELLETVQRLRRARSAWRVAVKLGEFLAEHPTP